MNGMELRLKSKSLNPARILIRDPSPIPPSDHPPTAQSFFLIQAPARPRAGRKHNGCFGRKLASATFSRLLFPVFLSYSTSPSHILICLLTFTKEHAIRFPFKILHDVTMHLLGLTLAMVVSAMALPQESGVRGAYDPFAARPEQRRPSNKWILGDQDTADIWDSPSPGFLDAKFQTNCFPSRPEQLCNIGICTSAVEDILTNLTGYLDGKGDSWPVTLVDVAKDRYKRVNATQYDLNQTTGCTASFHVNQTGVREASSIRELLNG